MPGNVNILDYGSGLGSGADATAAMAATVQEAVSLRQAVPNDLFIDGSQLYYSAPKVYVPAGIYTLSAPAVMGGVGLAGDGAGATVFVKTGDYGDTFAWAPNPLNADPVENLGIGGFQIVGVGAQPSKGAHLNLTACYQVRLNDLDLVNGFGGIDLSTCSNVSASDIRMGAGYMQGWTASPAGSFFLRIRAVTGSKYNYNSSTIFFNNFNFQGGCPGAFGPAYGIVVWNCDYSSFTNGYVGACANASLIVAPEAAADFITNAHFTSVEFDGNFENAEYYCAVVFNPANGQMRAVIFNSCDFVNGGIGLYSDAPGCQGMRVVNSTAANNKGAGLYLVDGSDWDQQSNFVWNNSLATPGAPQIVTGSDKPSVLPVHAPSIVTS